MHLFDLKQAANDGVPEAQFVIGILYQNGLGCKKNTAKAIEWYSRAAKGGCVAAQYSLGVIESGLQTGEVVIDRKSALSVKKSDGGAAAAFRLFLSAAKKGFWPAQDAIAGCFELGMGTKANHRKAFLWAKKCADAGYTQGDLRVASMCQEGHGTPVNKKKALHYYKRAASRGHGLAAFAIAQIYKEKKPSGQRDAQILAWLKRAAEVNYLGAHLELYWVYSKGLYGQAVNQKKADQHQTHASELAEALTSSNLVALDETADIVLIDTGTNLSAEVQE